MQKILFSMLLSAFFLSISCGKTGGSSNGSSNNNTNPPKGGVLFWTSNFSELNSCGALTIALDDGQQTNITGYYNVAPATCLNQVGGYMYLPQGKYTYTVTTGGGCNISGGTVNVIGNQCNLFRIP